MARKLTKGQKGILDAYPHVISHEGLPDYVLEICVDENDYETVYQDIDRYLFDKAMEKRFEG